MEARIAELEAELADAKRTIAKLRAVEDENRTLKDRVHDLHSELVTLTPPKLPAFSDAPVASAGTPSLAARARRSRLMTWTTLILVLIGAAVAALPYALGYIDSTHRSDTQFTNQRGLGNAPD